MVTDLPGLEVVAEGIDPRTPLLLDEIAATPDAKEQRRMFVYQRNIERLIRQPLGLQEDVLEILSRELEAHFNPPKPESGEKKLAPKGQG